MGNLLIRYL